MKKRAVAFEPLARNIVTPGNGRGGCHDSLLGEPA
jgi:hypothetical protein